MIYSLYIFDRHCEVVYYHDWHRQTPVTRARPGLVHPAVSPLVSPTPSPAPAPPPSSSTLAGQSRSALTPGSLNPLGGTALADPSSYSAEDATSAPPPTTAAAGGRGGGGRGKGGLPFDEEAKLVYGVVLSLRNMAKKLTGSPSSLFHTYTTPSYALHLFEAPTGLKFILLTSPLGADSAHVRQALRGMWGPTGAYGLWVVGNPMKGGNDDGESGAEREGLDSEQFRTAVDNQIRSLPYFAS